MVEYGLILGLVSIFVFAIMVALWGDRPGKSLLGDIEGYEGKTKTQLRDALLQVNTSSTTDQSVLDYLANKQNADPSDDLSLY